MHKRRPFSTSGIRLISASTSRAQTDRLVVKGKDLVRSLVEAAS